MSWSFNVSGGKAEATAQVEQQLENQRGYFNAQRLPVLEAAAQLVRSAIAAAPDDSSISISVGGHFDEPDVLTGTWFSTSIVKPT